MDNKNLQQRLLERLIRTEAIQVRTAAEDAPFWYTSGRPGPFYINVEKIAGQNAVAAILEQINQILVSSDSSTVKAQQVWRLISNRLDADPEYREVMALLVDFYRSGTTSEPAFISGGERRDWFFSIPFSQMLHVPHLFLLKKGGYWLLDSNGQPIVQAVSIANQEVLHVADIINTASSYIRYWVPNLHELNAQFKETLTVAVRNEEGVQALEAKGVRVRTPLRMDLAVFAEAHRLNLINSFSFQDIELFLTSPADWTRELLRSSSTLLLNRFEQMPSLDQSRMQSFVTADPYQLQNDYRSFFEQAKNLASHG